eukprot:gene12260-17800_t
MAMFAAKMRRTRPALCGGHQAGCRYTRRLCPRAEFMPGVRLSHSARDGCGEWWMDEERHEPGDWTDDGDAGQWHHQCTAAP